MREKVTGVQCRHVPSCPRCCCWPVDTGTRLVCPNCGFSGAVYTHEDAREESWRTRVRITDERSRRTVHKSWEG